MEKLKELLIQNQKIQEDHQKNMDELKELTESKKNILCNRRTKWKLSSYRKCSRTIWSRRFCCSYRKSGRK
jgi:hypothetical protein